MHKPPPLVTIFIEKKEIFLNLEGLRQGWQFHMAFILQHHKTESFPVRFI